MYASLHNHSYASNLRFLDSINRPEEMINKAIRLGFSGIAFTDHEALSAAVSIIKIRDKVLKDHPDFKIIFGNEIYLIDESEIKNTHKYYHFVLLAKDDIGWQQLRQLSSRAWDRGYTEKGIMRVPTTYQDIEEIVGSNPGHIFASTACLGGRLPNLILEHNVPEANNFIRWCINNFGKDNLSLELQPSYNEEQIIVNKTLIKLAKHYDVLYTITTDSHYLDKSDFAIHSAFLNSNLKKSGDRETEKFYKFTYIMTEDEMREILIKTGLSDDEITTGLQNTVQVANSISNIEFRHSTIVPCIKIPEFTLSKSLYHKGYEFIDKFYDSENEQDRYLMYQIENGVKNKVNTIDTIKLERINTELDVLDYISNNINQNLSAYLNLTVNIVDIAWQVSLVGCGRGSACGFYINYLIGITQVDPLVYDLPYWRFLNKERAELPDVDEDFQPEKTEDIIRLLRENYGEDNVLNCATFKTESLKSAILSCFPKGTQVLTKNSGLKNIEDITSQDSVYTSNGVERVIQPTHLLYSGDMYQLSAYKGYVGEDIECTSDHKFLIYGGKNRKITNVFNKRKSRCELYNADNLKIGDFTSINEAAEFYKNNYGGSASSLKKYSKHNGFYLKTKCADNSDFLYPGEIKWVEAKNIQQDDYLLSPIGYLQNNIQPAVLHFDKESQNPNKKYVNYINEDINIDQNFMELVGIFLAEGSLNNHSVSFSINREENNLKNHIIALIKKVFGLDEKAITINHSKASKCLTIQVSSSPLRRFFWYYICENQKRYAYTKKIPEILLSQDTQLLLSLIKGFFLGDGYARGRNNNNTYEAKLTTTSKILALQISDCLIRSGIKASCIYEPAGSTIFNTKDNYRTSLTHPVYNIMLYGDVAEELYNLKYNGDIKKHISPRSDFEIVEINNHKFIKSRIKHIKISRSVVNEDVYCLTVPSHNFVLNGILTHNCGRGLGYNNDDMQALAALVPCHRGKNYTLQMCLFGDEEEGFEPVAGFKDKLDVYPGLFEAVKKIEGLPTNSSIHASALYIFNDGYLSHNSMMRAPNKTKMTAFNMHDSDDMGALKMDVLRTDAQSKMAKCLDLLLKDKQIEWQGNLRNTYDKYLHPDVLDYTNPEMWSKAASGEIANLFQFETQVGSVCIKKARPTNVMQLAEINSIMRLQVEGDEQPIDRYVRFRNDINTWYFEMIEEGLSTEEIKILEKYLKDSFGISGSQEKLMLLVMDPGIAGFTLGEANGFRKAIAKKIAVKIQENKEKYFKKGHALGTRDVFLNYVWKYCVEPQLGYAFSLNHTLPYSIIAVQEMNLATRFHPLYWQCACLCVNAGNYVDEIGDDDAEDIVEEVEESDETNEENTTKEKRVAPNYGKIAKAISDAQLSGTRIELPDINESQIDFVPDIKNNSIFYSLQTVNVVGNDLLNKIMENRPFTSMEDFINKINPTKVQMIGLIKAGCFDKLVNLPRTTIMAKYLQMLADTEIPLKDKLTSVQLKKALELGLQLDGYSDEIRLFKFKKYIDKNQIDSVNKRYCLTEEACLRFFKNFIQDKLSLAKNEYGYLPDNAIFVKSSAFKKIYESSMEKLMTHLNSLEGRQAYQKLLQEEFIKDLRDKYCEGSLSRWEFDTMCFYHDGHELKGMNNMMYNTKNFNELPEHSTDKKLCTIAGTVVKSDNTRHIVSLLTNYGVVDVKFYAGTYTNFNQKISTVDPNTKKKVVLDDSWFKRGTKLIISGQRKENLFTAKNDYSSGFNRCVGKIDECRLDGTLDIHYTRIRR